MEIKRIKEHGTQMILQFAIPSIIAMVLTSMINIVDGMFIGRYVGAEGLAAVNLGLPIVYLYLAVGLMIAVGGISIAGRLLGEGEIESANQIFRQTIMVCAVVSFAITLVMFFLLTEIGSLFHASAMTMEYFEQYYGILIFELPIMVITSGLGMFIRGEGRPAFVMITNLVTVLLNAVLDYLFVATFSFGVTGIAAASLLSAFLVLVINIVYLTVGTKVFHFGKFVWNKRALLETFLNGGSEFIGELSMCLSMSAYNYVVLKHAGVAGLAAFTIIGYVSYVFSMIIIGFGQGIVPVISFSYGAKEKNLAAGIRNKTMGMVMAAAMILFLIMSFAAGGYCSLFTDKEGENAGNIADIVIPGLRLQMSSFLFAGINTIASFYFTAIGKAKESAVISASRGLIVLMLAILILPALFGITGVWLVSLTTETVTLLISVWYIKKEGITRKYSLNPAG